MGATYFGGVCVNLLRHPAWGRAQETYGEDPRLLGEMGAALTRGVQEHVLACVKHFACNSMENARFTVDVTVDDRALHEVYLPHFKRVVDEGVASVMSSYNSLNGEWAGQSRALLTDVLRDEWGFDGFVITDFIFGLRDPVRSVGAGLDVEMPFAQQRAVALRAALASETITRAELLAPATRVVATLLRFADRITASPPPVSVLAAPEHRALARRAAEESIVLLTNRGDLVPVAAKRTRRVVVLGRLAAVANLGDGGSSAVHPPSVVTPLAGLRDAFGRTREWCTPTPTSRSRAAPISWWWWWATRRPTRASTSRARTPICSGCFHRSTTRAWAARSRSRRCRPRRRRGRSSPTRRRWPPAATVVASGCTPTTRR